MSALRMRVHLDPAPAHRAQLAAYPADDLWPDFGVLTSGALTIDLGGQAVAYQHGVPTPRPAGADDARVWLPDYLGAFLPRLAAAALDLAPDRPTEAHLVDAPAALTFRLVGDAVAVSFLDRGRTIVATTVARPALRAAVAAAMATFLADLLALNARLADHPEVADLQRQLAALALPEAG